MSELNTLAATGNQIGTVELGTNGYMLFLLNKLLVFWDCIHFDELLAFIRARLNIIYMLTQKTYINTKWGSHLVTVVAVVGVTVVAECPQSVYMSRPTSHFQSTFHC